jgi:hypothetical protein
MGVEDYQLEFRLDDVRHFKIILTCSVFFFLLVVLILTHSPLMLFLDHCTASPIIIYTAALSSLKENGCCSI